MPISSRTAFRVVVAVMSGANFISALDGFDGTLRGWIGVIVAGLILVYLPPAAWKYSKCNASAEVDDGSR